MFFRVRVEILRSLGTILTAGPQLAYCVATQSRPYLSVGPAQGSASSGRRKSYRFVDAIRSFGKMMEHCNLDRAYERAGPYFIGMFA